MSAFNIVKIQEWASVNHQHMRWVSLATRIGCSFTAALLSVVPMAVWPYFPGLPDGPSWLLLLFWLLSCRQSYVSSFSCALLGKSSLTLIHLLPYAFLHVPFTFSDFHFLQLFAYFHLDRPFISILTYLKHKLSSFCSSSLSVSLFQLIAPP